MSDLSGGIYYLPAFMCGLRLSEGENFQDRTARKTCRRLIAGYSHQVQLKSTDAPRSSGEKICTPAPFLVLLEDHHDSFKRTRDVDLYYLHAKAVLFLKRRSMWKRRSIICRKRQIPLRIGWLYQWKATVFSTRLYFESNRLLRVPPFLHQLPSLHGG